MKVFGKDLFTKRKVPNELYDFAKHGLISTSSFINVADWNLQAVSGDDEITTKYLNDADSKNKKKAEKPKITPKELYSLEALNTPDQVLNCDPAYLDKHIKTLERKINLLPTPKDKGEPMTMEAGKIKYGRDELQSLVIRMQNRHKYREHQEFFNEYPYTTSETIERVVDGYSNLKTARVEEFIPDMPDDALEAMEQYNAHTRAMCGLNAVFYIIADRKDFEKSTQKRDPVLLAQSPFGLTWQILGAWDEEMILLEAL